MKALIFDFWGTLVENGVFPSPVRQVKYLLRLEMPFSEYIEKFEEAFMLEKFDNLTEAFKNVAKTFNVNPPAFVLDKLVGLWNKNRLFAKLYPETEKTLEDLKKTYKLVLLSNTDCFSVEPLLEKFDIAKHFDNVTLSYQEGMLKTNPKVFAKILKKIKVKKKEALMIGDSIDSDMRAAQNAKIQGLLIDRRERREFEPKIKSLTEIQAFLDKG